MRALLPVLKAEFLSGLLPWWRQGRLLPVGDAYAISDLFLCQGVWYGTGDRPELVREWKSILKAGSYRHGLFHNFRFQYSIMIWWGQAFHAKPLSLLVCTLCLSLLLRNVPVVLMLSGECAVTISYNLRKTIFFLFQDLSLIIIVFHFKCKTFIISLTNLYIQLQLQLLVVWFGKN